MDAAALIQPIVLTLQEDDCEPQAPVTLAGFAASSPDGEAEIAQAAALGVGESFSIQDGPHAPVWTITRIA